MCLKVEFKHQIGKACISATSAVRHLIFSLTRSSLHNPINVFEIMTPKCEDMFLFIKNDSHLRIALFFYFESGFQNVKGEKISIKCFHLSDSIPICIILYSLISCSPYKSNKKFHL